MKGDQNDRVQGAVEMGGPVASLEDTWDCPSNLIQEGQDDSDAAALSDIVTACLVSEPEPASTQNHWLDTGKDQRERSGPVRANSQLIPQARYVPCTTTVTTVCCCLWPSVRFPGNRAHSPIQRKAIEICMFVLYPSILQNLLENSNYCSRIA